ncbi:MAG: polysaccharide export protein EpsE [Thiobacillus sp.]|nr:polysaccharide export protein EpsE [Thiobacillus sp.]
MTVLGLFAAGAVHAANDYALATGDLVRVTVYDQPDLTTETRVNESGAILFPLVGSMNVKGLTATEASSRISQALQEGGFVKNAQVNLVVLDFKGQEVSVLGQVNRPGKFPLQKASRITDVMAMAGGSNAAAADTLVLISSVDGKTTRREIDLLALFGNGGDAMNAEIGNNDILYVPRQPLFYIYGEVQRPGAFRLEQNMTVVQALSVGGGLTPRGTQKGMQILRRSENGSLQTLDARLADQLKPDDVIHVKESLF